MFKVSPDGVTWRCTQCDSDNKLDATTCRVCGTSFADILRPPPQRPERDPNTVALYALFFPGAGHAYLGMWGEAVTRGVLALWVNAVAFAAFLQEGGSAATALAMVFGLCGFLLWVVSAHDAYRSARREPARAILKGKGFLYLVLALLMILFLMVVGSGLAARNG